jgi:hypothetical protein
LLVTRHPTPKEGRAVLEFDTDGVALELAARPKAFGNLLGNFAISG